MLMSNVKAPGADGIVTELLKEALHMLCPVMLSLYNKILHKGNLPVWFFFYGSEIWGF